MGWVQYEGAAYRSKGNPAGAQPDSKLRAFGGAQVADSIGFLRWKGRSFYIWFLQFNDWRRVDFPIDITDFDPQLHPTPADPTGRWPAHIRLKVAVSRWPESNGGASEAGYVDTGWGYVGDVQRLNLVTMQPRGLVSRLRAFWQWLAAW